MNNLHSDLPDLSLEAEATQFYRHVPCQGEEATAPMRGVIWGVIFSSPFWLLAILIVLGFMK